MWVLSISEGSVFPHYLRSGRTKDATADVNVKVAHILVMCDSRQDLRSKASEVGVSLGAVQLILTIILGMSKVSARWVPRMLTVDLESFRLDISRYLLSRYEDDFLSFSYYIFSSIIYLFVCLFCCVVIFVVFLLLSWFRAKFDYLK